MYLSWYGDFQIWVQIRIFDENGCHGNQKYTETLIAYIISFPLYNNCTKLRISYFFKWETYAVNTHNSFWEKIIFRVSMATFRCKNNHEGLNSNWIEEEIRSKHGWVDECGVFCMCADESRSVCVGAYNDGGVFESVFDGSGVCACVWWLWCVRVCVSWFWSVWLCVWWLWGVWVGMWWRYCMSLCAWRFPFTIVNIQPFLSLVYTKYWVFHLILCIVPYFPRVKQRDGNDLAKRRLWHGKHLLMSSKYGPRIFPPW